MATELTNAGYESIRDLINSSRTSPAQWDYIALVDDGGNEVIRAQISNDADASWSADDQDGDSTSETMVVTYTITGADVSTPVTIVKSQLYNDASGSGAPVLSEDSFTSATLDADSDELTVTHKVEVPKVA